MHSQKGEELTWPRAANVPVTDDCILEQDLVCICVCVYVCVRAHIPHHTYHSSAEKEKIKISNREVNDQGHMLSLLTPHTQR